MKAICINKPGEVVIKDIPMPVRKPGEALLKLLYGGICGSDLGSYRGTFVNVSYPRIPGHEFSAEIVEIDENDRGLKPGMVVTCNPYYNCGKCYACKRGFLNACMNNQTLGCQREGAFSEYFSIPIDRIYDGKGLSAKVLVAIEPFCISYHGVQRAGIRKGDKVLIVGGGTIGVLAANAAKALGGEVYLCDVPQAAGKLQRSMDAFGFAGTILNEGPEAMEAAMKKITGSIVLDGKERGYGFDVCIEAVGLPQTFQTCIDLCATGGNVVLIGVGKKNLDFDFTDLQRKELNVFGSRNALKQDFLDLIDLVKEGKVDLEKIITNVYPAEDAARAFAEFSEHSSEMLKVCLDFTNFGK